MVANNHTFRVKEGGMMGVEEADEENDEGERGSGAGLPSEGWTYRAVEPAERQASR